MDSTPLPAYGFGLMTFDGAASFDNVKVYGLSARSYYAFGAARVAERATSHAQAAGSGGLEDCGLLDCGLRIAGLRIAGLLDCGLLDCWIAGLRIAGLRIAGLRIAGFGVLRAAEAGGQSAILQSANPQYVATRSRKKGDTP